MVNKNKDAKVKKKKLSSQTNDSKPICESPENSVRYMDPQEGYPPREEVLDLLCSRLDKNIYPAPPSHNMTHNQTNQDRDKSRVIEYLLLHRQHSVSLADISGATDLDKDSALEILAGLSEEEVINYQMNTTNENSKKYVGRYRKALGRGFTNMYKKSN